MRQSKTDRNKMDYIELMHGYAKKGLRDWENASYSIKQDAEQCLASRYLADKEEFIRDALQQKQSSSSPKFIPMPQPGFTKREKMRVQWAFFAPVGSGCENKDILSFDLLILYEKKQCLAFRLELGHPKSKSHKYSHLQFNQKLYKRRVQVEGIPSFISDSFPAFPLPSLDTISLFFAMIVAVHGYEGTQIILRHILQENNDIKNYGKYSAALDDLLKLDRNGS